MIGQYKRDLTVVPYRPEWVTIYQQEAALLIDNLAENALQIEHIGSTSVPGLAAKPIIDIMVAVESLNKAAALIPLVESLGYIHRPHDTIPERLFFAKESAPEIRTHHLNLTQVGSGFWAKQLAFRDYLRSHGDVAAEYVELKKGLAEEYAKTGNLPLEGKTAFVSRVLALAASEVGTDG